MRKLIALFLSLVLLGCGWESGFEERGTPEPSAPASVDFEGATWPRGGCSSDLECAGAAGSCEVDVCIQGACATAPAWPGAACDPGSLGECEAGVCAGLAGAALSCVKGPAPDGLPCMLDGWDPPLGVRTCRDGACAEATECHTDGDCAAQDDSDLCNGRVVCVEQYCILNPATVVDCSGTEVGDCEVPVCVAETGACVGVPAEDGLACDDGDPCTGDDQCVTGACTGETVLCETDCDNDEDDNNNGKTDCDDEECEDDPVCQIPECPDGECNGDETCDTCPQDCGACITSCEGHCGEYDAATFACSCDPECHWDVKLDCCEDMCAECETEEGFQDACPFCGNDDCSAGETCDTCPGDCGACACPDEACNGDETCETCPADCGACPPECPDGECNGDETCETCPADCGACPPECPDGECNGDETCSTCPEDCGACITSCEGHCGDYDPVDYACSCDPGCFTSLTEECCEDMCDACTAWSGFEDICPSCGNFDCSPDETCASCPADCGACPLPPVLFFSEYVEGGNNNKAFEVYNGGTTAVDLQDCEVLIYNNGSSNGTSAALSPAVETLLAPDTAWALCNTSGTIPDASCDHKASLQFNGDDAVALVCGGVTLDVFGQIGFDPGDFWGTETAGTKDHTLRRLCTVTAGDPVGSDVFDPSVEWAFFANNTFGGLGAHCTE
ncbi:MAG: hypothetical protein FJ098_00655 [Deltaproteobacteria bacterium]|nr:hypothetical protein [Deltaproteobacteria bacterium]